MKTLFRLFFLMFFSVIILSSCGIHHTHAVKKHKAAPGQVKKDTGSKSAKPYAPGQRKKRYKNLP